MTHVCHTACLSLDLTYLSWRSVLRMEPRLAHTRQALCHYATSPNFVPRSWSLTGPWAVVVWLGSVSESTWCHSYHMCHSAQTQQVLLHSWLPFCSSCDPRAAVCHMLLQARAAFIVGHGESQMEQTEHRGGLSVLCNKVS